MVSSTPRPHFTSGKDPVPILQEAGWAPGPVWAGGKSRPHRDSIPDHPARSQSLYRLGYPAHLLFLRLNKIDYICNFSENTPLSPKFVSWANYILILDLSHAILSSALRQFAVSVFTQDGVICTTFYSSAHLINPYYHSSRQFKSQEQEP